MSSFHFILFILFYFIALIVFICLVFYLRPFYSFYWYLVLHFAYLLSLFQLFKFFFTLSKFYYHVYVWVGHTVGVCVFSCVNRKRINRKRRLSTFPELEICHPQEKASVWFQLIPSDSECQQYSSLFPACGRSYLDHLRQRRRENTSASVLTSLVHSERSFRWTLPHRDYKWAEITTNNDSGVSTPVNPN